MFVQNLQVYMSQDIAFLADLAVQAYHSGKKNYDNGYEFVTPLEVTDAASGFNGFSAINLETKSMVISFCGTATSKLFTNDALDFAMDALSDIHFALGNVIPQLEDANYLYQSSLAYLKELGQNIEDFTITFTGHSLGGILAEVMAVEHINDVSMIEAVAFDPPGVRDYIEKFYSPEDIQKAEAYIITVLPEPNIVNCYGKQLGDVYLLNQDSTMLSKSYAEKLLDVMIYGDTKSFGNLFVSHQPAFLLSQIGAIESFEDYRYYKWNDKPNHNATIDGVLTDVAFKTVDGVYAAFYYVESAVHSIDYKGVYDSFDHAVHSVTDYLTW
jgi:hypothetical protein